MSDRLLCTAASPMPKDAKKWEWVHPDAVYRDDEYNGLSGGGDYSIYDCPHCGRKLYVELPD